MENPSKNSLEALFNILKIGDMDEKNFFTVIKCIYEYKNLLNFKIDDIRASLNKIPFPRE